MKMRMQIPLAEATPEIDLDADAREKLERLIDFVCEHGLGRKAAEQAIYESLLRFDATAFAKRPPRHLN
jgi:hypothetical protein